MSSMATLSVSRQRQPTCFRISISKSFKTLQKNGILHFNKENLTSERVCRFHQDNHQHELQKRKLIPNIMILLLTVEFNEIQSCKAEGVPAFCNFEELAWEILCAVYNSASSLSTSRCRSLAFWHGDIPSTIELQVEPSAGTKSALHRKVVLVCQLLCQSYTCKRSVEENKAQHTITRNVINDFSVQLPGYVQHSCIHVQEHSQHLNSIA